MVSAPSGAGTTAICSCIKAYQVSPAQRKERNRLEMALAVFVPLETALVVLVPPPVPRQQ